ncbi:MAG: ribosome small subunit-dependent GTPase A [Chloroflexi bacterium]|nr:ribosome small subunit-dependent GTPase A [Chloroflexota bacterium]
MSDQHHETQTGFVYKKLPGTYYVESGGRTVVCAISSKLRKVLLLPPRDPKSLPYYRVYAVADIKSIDPVAIGDEVRFVEGLNAGGDDTQRVNLIVEVLPRRNALMRLATDQRKLQQVVVANVDQVVAVIAGAKPVPDLIMLDRFLAMAEASDIPALICITKADQPFRDYVTQAINAYRRIGYTVIETSALDGRGVAEVRAAISGQRSAFVGMSGVGKTSLLNAVQPELGLRVNAVNQRTGEGRHTTSHLEMFALESGGAIVDTPGMREFALWEIEGNELALLFREMNPLVGTCKFGADCQHVHEPGCAIKQAVEAGEIAESRYRSYVKILTK